MSGSPRPPRLPGRSLHALARRMVDDAALREVIEPTLADLQHEVAAAARRGRIRQMQARWAGYVAFWRVLGMQLAPWRCPMDVRLALRMAGIAVLAVFGYAFVLQVLPSLAVPYPPPVRLAWLRFVMVRAIGATMPYALFAAVLLFARRVSTQDRGRQARSFAVVTAVAALTVLVLSTWLLPHALLDLDRARGQHAVTVSTSTFALIQSRLHYPVGCAVFALLGIALAPHLRSRVGFLLVILLVPMVFLFVESVYPLVVRGYPTGIRIAIGWSPYALVACLATWLLLRTESRTART